MRSVNIFFICFFVIILSILLCFFHLPRYLNRPRPGSNSQTFVNLPERFNRWPYCQIINASRKRCQLFQQPRPERNGQPDQERRHAPPWETCPGAFYFIFRNALFATLSRRAASKNDSIRFIIFPILHFMPSLFVSDP